MSQCMGLVRKVARQSMQHQRKNTIVTSLGISAYGLGAESGKAIAAARGKHQGDRGVSENGLGAASVRAIIAALVPSLTNIPISMDLVHTARDATSSHRCFGSATIEAGEDTIEADLAYATAMVKDAIAVFRITGDFAPRLHMPSLSRAFVLSHLDRGGSLFLFKLP